MTSGRRSRPRSRAAAAADAASPEDATRSADRAEPAGGDGADRPAALRLARLHLRMGSLPLARAELESLAGRAMLDEDALLDLAEVRWRTGDLAGGGRRANALLARGRRDVLALVIAAESVSAQGRPGEARRLAGGALAAAEGPLETLFAGMPRSMIWPAEEPSPAHPRTPGASSAGSRTRRRCACRGRRRPARRRRVRPGVYRGGRGVRGGVPRSARATRPRPRSGWGSRCAWSPGTPTTCSRRSGDGPISTQRSPSWRATHSGSSGASPRPTSPTTGHVAIRRVGDDDPGDPDDEGDERG